jgi:hypothetical protein
MIFDDVDATGLEEDARLTAMWLWTQKSEGGEVNNSTPHGLQVPMTIPYTIGSEDDETDSDVRSSSLGGFALEYDAARKIAQGLGVHLERLEGLVEVKGDKARLLSVSERARRLFGKGDDILPGKRNQKPQAQMSLFSMLNEVDAEAAGWDEHSIPPSGETSLDRVHQAMLLFASGHGGVLKRFLVDQGVGKDNRFWRLAQALSALYPPGTDEKRWIDGILAKKKGLGY